MSRSRDARKKVSPQAASSSSAPASEQESRRREKKNVAKHSAVLFWITAVAVLAIFLGRWAFAITDGYFASFVQRDASVSSAVANMTGLTPSVTEQEQLLSLQREWDLFTSSRLRDEVTAVAGDGTTLHGYLYDEDSDITVVVLPRFNQDGTADFLPGPWFHEAVGCNFLMPDPRAHGASGGDYFGFGYLEQNDLACWLDRAEEAMGNQTFIIWGEGTGANTALFAAASGLLPESVSFVVAESPYASLHELAYENIWKWYRVPAIPFLYPIEWKLADSDAGYTVQDADLGAALAGAETQVPVLFLQSAGDEYILPEWTQAACDAYSGPKELISGGLTHGTVYPDRQDEIHALLSQWLAS